MKRSTNDSMPVIPRSVLWTSVVRVVMLLVFVASVALAWYSVYYRLPPVEQLLRKKFSERAGLANEVQQLEKRWKVDEAKRTEARFKEAGERLFAGPEERDLWEENVKSRGISLVFEATVQVDNAQPHPQVEHKLIRYRATIDLQPVPASRSSISAYKRLLGFVKTLQSGNRRMDVVELSVIGGPNSTSIQKATVVVQLWSQEPN